MQHARVLSYMISIGLLLSPCTTITNDDLIKGLITGAQLYALLTTTLLIHEAGHACADRACGNRGGIIAFGGLPPKPIIMDLGLIKVFGFNPTRAAYKTGTHIKKTATQQVISSIAGPLAALAFSYAVGTQLAPDSPLRYFNEALKIISYANYFPYTADNNFSSDGMAICKNTGIEPNIMRSIIGPLVLYQTYNYLSKCKNKCI